MGTAYLVKEDELVLLMQMIRPGNRVAGLFSSGEYDHARSVKSISGLKAKGMIREKKGQLQIDPVIHLLASALTEAVCMISGAGVRIFPHQKVSILIEDDMRCRGQLRITPLQDWELLWSGECEILDQSGDWNLYHLRTEDEIICHAAEDVRKWVKRWCKRDE